MPRKLDKKGFSAVEGLLIAVIILIIGSTGYYVYHANKNTNDTLNSAAKSAQSQPAAHVKKAQVTDATKDWLTHDDTFFSFKYPKGWTEQACDQNSVLLGPTADSAGHCQSDATPEMYISAVVGDKRDDNQLKTSEYPDLKQGTVTVKGVSGTKSTGTLNTGQETFVGPANGSKVVQYVFYANGKTYVLNYTQTPQFSDVQTDFDLLVTQTFNFK